jgi:type IV secretory pathway VirB10-like protein
MDRKEVTQMRKYPIITGAVFIIMFIIVAITYGAQGNETENIAANIPSQTVKAVIPSRTHSPGPTSTLIPEPSFLPTLTPEPSSLPKQTQAPTPKPSKSTAPSPTLQPAQESAVAIPSDNETVTVYITEAGEKYHKSGCQYLSHSRIPIDLDEAIDRGYTPCSRCHPPR